MNRRALMTAAGLALVMAVSYSTHDWLHNIPPFDAADIHVVATVQPLEGSARDRIHKLDPGGQELVGGEGHQMLRGTINWDVLPGMSADWHKDGVFRIVILDKRVNLKPAFVIGTSQSDVKVLTGNHSVLNQVADRYSWLSGAGDIKLDPFTLRQGGWTLATAPAAGSVSFLAHFPRLRDESRRFLASAPIARSDILVAMVFIGADSQIYWASRLYG